MRLPAKNPNFGSNTIDALVFDFDGTLANTLESSLLTLESTLLHFGINLPKSLSINTYGPLSVAGMFYQAGVSKKEMLQTLVKHYNTLYREIAPIIAWLYPGVRSTLNIWMGHGYCLAIATNESRENLDLLLDAFDIRPIFNTTCCADEVRQPKPLPDMGRKILTTLGTSPSRSLMVGDSVCDIEMARNTYMRSCAVSWGATTFDRLLESSPSLAITDFSHLLDILDISKTNLEFHNIFVNKTTGKSENG